MGRKRSRQTSGGSSSDSDIEFLCELPKGTSLTLTVVKREPGADVEPSPRPAPRPARKRPCLEHDEEDEVVVQEAAAESAKPEPAVTTREMDVVPPTVLASAVTVQDPEDSDSDLEVLDVVPNGTTSTPNCKDVKMVAGVISIKKALSETPSKDSSFLDVDPKVLDGLAHADEGDSGVGLMLSASDAVREPDGGETPQDEPPGTGADIMPVLVNAATEGLPARPQTPVEEGPTRPGTPVDEPPPRPKTPSTAEIPVEVPTRPVTPEVEMPDRPTTPIPACSKTIVDEVRVLEETPVNEEPSSPRLETLVDSPKTPVKEALGSPVHSAQMPTTPKSPIDELYSSPKTPVKVALGSPVHSAQMSTTPKSPIDELYASPKTPVKEAPDSPLLSVQTPTTAVTSVEEPTASPKTPVKEAPDSPVLSAQTPVTAVTSVEELTASPKTPVKEASGSPLHSAQTPTTPKSPVDELIASPKTPTKEKLGSPVHSVDELPSSSSTSVDEPSSSPNTLHGEALGSRAETPTTPKTLVSQIPSSPKTPVEEVPGSPVHPAVQVPTTPKTSLDVVHASPSTPVKEAPASPALQPALENAPGKETSASSETVSTNAVCPGIGAEEAASEEEGFLSEATSEQLYADVEDDGLGADVEIFVEEVDIDEEADDEEANDKEADDEEVDGCLELCSSPSTGAQSEDNDLRSERFLEATFAELAQTMASAAGQVDEEESGSTRPPPVPAYGDLSRDPDVIKFDARRWPRRRGNKYKWIADLQAKPTHHEVAEPQETILVTVTSDKKVVESADLRNLLNRKRALQAGSDRASDSDRGVSPDRASSSSSIEELEVVKPIPVLIDIASSGPESEAEEDGLSTRTPSLEEIEPDVTCEDPAGGKQPQSATRATSARPRNRAPLEAVAADKPTSDDCKPHITAKLEHPLVEIIPVLTVEDTPVPKFWRPWHLQDVKAEGKAKVPAPSTPASPRLDVKENGDAGRTPAADGQEAPPRSRSPSASEPRRPTESLPAAGAVSSSPRPQPASAAKVSKQGATGSSRPALLPLPSHAPTPTSSLGFSDSLDSSLLRRPTPPPSRAESDDCVILSPPPRAVGPAGPRPATTTKRATARGRVRVQPLAALVPAAIKRNPAAGPAPRRSQASNASLPPVRGQGGHGGHGGHGGYDGYDGFDGPHQRQGPQPNFHREVFWEDEHQAYGGGGDRQGGYDPSWGRQGQAFPMHLQPSNSGPGWAPPTPPDQGYWMWENAPGPPPPEPHSFQHAWSPPAANHLANAQYHRGRPGGPRYRSGPQPHRGWMPNKYVWRR